MRDSIIWAPFISACHLFSEVWQFWGNALLPIQGWLTCWTKRDYPVIVRQGGFWSQGNGRPGPGASFIRAPGPLCRDAGSNFQPPRNWCSTSLRNVDHDTQDTENFWFCGWTLCSHWTKLIYIIKIQCKFPKATPSLQSWSPPNFAPFSSVISEQLEEI